MSPPLDEQYLIWLYRQTGSIKLRNPAKTHWALARQLFRTEFVWFIPNDDNRVADGKDLRAEFVTTEGLRDDVTEEWLHYGCSVLEMLVALSRRLAFESEGGPRAWFATLIENLHLNRVVDTRYNEQEVTDKIDALIWRNYKYTGEGGLFPLKYPDRDQRDVEIWYQLNAYLMERD